MFPIPWNKSYRKKDGTLVNMEDVTGGGGSSDFLRTLQRMLEKSLV